MYKRLVTFGCSNTHGEGLDNPMKESWPAQLGEMMNVEVINHGVPGSSNDRIMRLFLENVHKLEDDDFVIIMWTFYERMETLVNGNWLNIGTWSLSNPDAYVKNIARAFHESIYSMAGQKYKNLRDLHHAQEVLKGKGVNYIMSSTHHNMFNMMPPNNLDHLIDWGRIPDTMETRLLNIRTKYPAAPDGHPGKEAHHKLAEGFYDWMINHPAR